MRRRSARSGSLRRVRSTCTRWCRCRSRSCGWDRTIQGRSPGSGSTGARPGACARSCRRRSRASRRRCPTCTPRSAAGSGRRTRPLAGARRGAAAMAGAQRRHPAELRARRDRGGWARPRRAAPAAQAGGGGSGQQDGPHRVGHDDDRRGVSASAARGRRLTGRRCQECRCAARR